jgi:glycine cleavage system T protein
MAHRSPLNDLHRSLGAVCVEEHGWELPARFQDPVREHRAVREDAGVLDLAFRTLIRVTGTERTRFLNGMLTNDIARLEAGKGCYACMLTPQGKILADLEVYAFHDYHLLEMGFQWTERALDHLNKYVIADDVSFEALQEETLIALQGPRARAILGSLLPCAPPPVHEQGCTELTLDGHRCRLMQASITGEDGYKLALSGKGVHLVWQALQEAGATPAGMLALNSLRLEAGIPWFGTDFAEGNFPQEAGIEDRAVSFTKGCYLGQEFVIRIAHRGHVNRRICGLMIGGESLPHPGDRVVRDEKEIGQITSTARSPSLGKIIALAMLRREAHDPGTAVDVVSHGENMRAEVTPLPFYRRRSP